MLGFRPMRGARTGKDVLLRGMRSITECFAEGVCVVDEQDRVLLLNGALSERLGHEAEAVEGADVSYVLASHDPLRIIGVYASAVEGPVSEFNVVFQAASGEGVSLSTSLSPWRDERGIAIGAILLTREMHTTQAALADASRWAAREKRRAEDIKNELVHAGKLAAIGQIAAGVTHEINNPAAYIRLSLGVLRERVMDTKNFQADDSFVELLEDCIEGIDRIASITKDLTRFSRQEKDDAGLVDMRAVIDFACKLASEELKYVARLERQLSEAPFVAGSRSRLTQVVTNLLVNAAHAIGPGAPEEHRVRVSLASEQGSVVIEVEDTGCGIDVANQKKIFEPFFTTKAREKGTGLGLSLCRDIARSHGGTLTVSSKVGLGSTFRLILPVSAQQQLPPLSAEPAPSESNVKARVLVIDDEAIVRKIVRRALNKHDVTCVESGDEGLALLRANQGFDVILCDMMMGEQGGLEVRASIQREMPELLDRLVFWSGGARSPEAQSFLTSGAHEVLEKPLSLRELRRVVRETAEKSGVGEPVASD
jgi:PAS domain S-box-containing protein